MAVLLPVDPYTKSVASKKNVTFEVSSVAGKPGRGKSTGVDLRWHTVEEFTKPSDAQKKELSEWQKSKDGKKVIASAKTTYFNNKRKRISEKSDSNRPPKKRNDQAARIAALEKQLEDQTKIASGSF